MKKRFILTLVVLIIGTFGTLKAQCNGYDLKVVKGTLSKYKGGTWVGDIVGFASNTGGVTDFDCKKDLIIVVYLNGAVVKFDFSGNYKGKIIDPTEGRAKKAKINGDLIHITLQNGKIVKYDFNGNMKGWL
jgi:hypothetical protein